MFCFIKPYYWLVLDQRTFMLYTHQWKWVIQTYEMKYAMEGKNKIWKLQFRPATCKEKLVGLVKTEENYAFFPLMDIHILKKSN